MRTPFGLLWRLPVNRYSDDCKVYENCRLCQHGATHPPVLAIYDDTERDYVRPDGPVCMARWASTNSSHAAGSICGAPATHDAGDVDLCQHHFNRVYEWRFWEKPLKDIKEKTAALKAADAEYRQAVRESEIHRERVKAEISVVYYIRRTSDGMVKIGTTGAFRKRMATFRNEFGEIQILMTHSGGRPEELKMHRQFDAYRIRGSEWFRPARTLLEWICDERRIVRYRETQQPGVLGIGALQKLTTAAPRDRDLRFRAGRVEWPEEADEIERILLSRPWVPQRNWYPGETLARLATENRGLGVAA